jgi:hypothetical protein
MDKIADFGTLLKHLRRRAGLYAVEKVRFSV